MSDVSHRENSEGILRRALGELLDRESKLAPFLHEIEDVRRAIKLLEKALAKPPSTVKGGAAQSGPNPRARFGERVLAVITGALEPMTSQQIALALDREPGGYLDSVLKQLDGQGRLEQKAGRWRIPHAIDNDPDAPPVEQAALDAAGVETL